jgi:hypothetical protein
LYLKIEREREPYPDILPPFQPKKRLKIGTFRVELMGFKLGERFLKIIFDNAIKESRQNKLIIFCAAWAGHDSSNRREIRRV